MVTSSERSGLRDRPLRQDPDLRDEHRTWRQLQALARLEDALEQGEVGGMWQHDEAQLDAPIDGAASPADRAQDLFYLSRRREGALGRSTLLQVAAHLDPDNLDARLADARLDANPGLRSQELVALAGEAMVRLGEEEDEEPGARRELELYVLGRAALRINIALALDLLERGQIHPAIDVLLEVLRLDTEREMDAHLVLAPLLVEADDPQRAEAVLTEGPEGTAAFAAWSRLLVRAYRGQATDEDWTSARRLNRYVERLIVCPSHLLVPMPVAYAPGSVHEAQVIAGASWRAWRSRPQLIEELHRRIDGGTWQRKEPNLWRTLLEAQVLLPGQDPGLAGLLRRRHEKSVRLLRRLLDPSLEHVSSHVRAGAACQLGRLQANEAAPEIVRLILLDMGETEAETALMVAALGGLNRAAAEPLVDALERMAPSDVKMQLARTLAQTCVKSVRIRDALGRCFAEFPEVGAEILAIYGDPAGIDMLRARLATLDPVDDGAIGRAIVRALDTMGQRIEREEIERWDPLPPGQDGRFEGPKGRDADSMVEWALSLPKEL
ncbi:MAG: hypothetical protein AB7T63_03750 [Planctomycetota bacterium]